MASTTQPKVHNVMFTGELCSCTRSSLAEILVLDGTAGADKMAPPTSTRIFARLKRVQGHGSPVNVLVCTTGNQVGAAGGCHFRGSVARPPGVENRSSHRPWRGALRGAPARPRSDPSFASATRRAGLANTSTSTAPAAGHAKNNIAGRIMPF